MIRNVDIRSAVRRGWRGGVIAASVVLLGCVLPSAASAATFWWAGPSDGLWSSTTSWSTVSNAATPNPAAAPGSINTAIFNISTLTAPQTVYLNGNQSALGLSFISSGSTTITGGADGAPAANTLTIGTSGITLSSDAGPVTLSSAGTLSNSGTYSLAAGTSLTASSPLGGRLLAVGGGTMSFSGGLSTSNRIFVGSGGTLIQNGGAATASGEFLMVGGNDGGGGAPALSSSGTFLMQSGTLTLGRGIYLGWRYNAAATTSAGTLTQTGGLIETQANDQGIQIGIGYVSGTAGSGTYNLNGGTLLSNFGSSTNIPYAGSFNFGGGTFKARTSFNTNSQSTVTTTVASGATAFIDTNGNTVAWSTALTGTGAVGLTKLGSGTLTLSSTSNTYGGTTTISAGVLAVSNDGSLGTAPASATVGRIVIDGGTLSTTTGFTLNANRGIAVGPTAASGTGTINVATGTLTYAGIIANNASGTGGLVKSGAGTLSLSGTNTYGGATTVSQGRLQISTTAALPGFATAGRVSVANDATLAVGTDVSAADFATLANAGNFTAGSTLGYDTGGGSRTVSIALVGNYGLTKTGANTLALSGSNSYAGTTLVSAGYIQAGSASAFSTGMVTVGGGARGGGIDLNGQSLSNPFLFGFQASGPGDVGVLQNQNTGTTSALSGNVVIGGENYVGGNGSVTLTGVVSGGLNTTYSLLKQGTGTWRFDNTANTFDGFYYQFGGTTEVTKLASLNESSSLGRPTVAAQNRFSFGLNGAGGGTLRFTGTDASTSDRVFVLQGSTDAASNRIEASGVSSAATLTLTGSLSTTRAGAYTLALGGTNAGVNTVSGVIANGSGTVGILKDSTATWRLAGANTFIGPTTVTTGTFVLDYATQNNSKLGDAAVLALGSSTSATVTLDLTGGSHTEAVGSTTLAGRTAIIRSSGLSVIQLGTVTRSNSLATLTLGASGIATTSSLNTNGILGAWALVGGSEWATNSTNAANGSIVAYTGYTDIDAQGSSITSDTASNVRVNAAGLGAAISLGAGTTDVNTLMQATTTTATIDTAGKTLRLGAAGGILVQANQGTLTFGTAAGSGTLTAGGADNTAGTFAVTTLESATAAVNAVITNNGTGVVSLVKSGPGALALSGSNTFTGGTVISGGTVALSGGPNRLPTTGTVTFAGGGLDLGSSSQTLAGVVIVPGGGTIAGSGTLTYSGTYALGGNGLAISAPLAGNLWAIGSGTLTTSGGLASTSNRIVAGGGANVVQSGGSVTTTTYLMVGRNDGTEGPATTGAAIYTLSSGTLTIGQGIYLGWTTGNSGTFTQNGGFVETQTNNQGIQIGMGGGAGAYLLNSGTLFSNFGSGGGTYGGSFTFGGGTFRARTVFNTNSQSTVTTAIASGATAFIDTNGNTVTWTAPLTGTAAAGLTKLGAGTLALNGTNTYAGMTRIVAGSLSLGSGLALQGTTLDLNAADVGTISAISTDGTFGGLTGSRNLNMLTRTLSIGNNNQSTTYSGGLSNGSLRKVGSGTLTLSGSNGYTGSTTVEAGVLRIGAGGAAGSLASSSISVANGALLTFNRIDNYGGAISSVISGSGGVRVQTGFLTLAGLNTYTGATDVLAGSSLAVNGSLANSSLTVASGATLMGSGTIAGLTTIAGLHRPGNSPGVETFTNLTYNSGASVQWELWGNTASNSPTAFDQIAVNGDLTFSGGTTLDLVFTGSVSPSSLSSVSWANAFWDSNQEWLLYDVAGTLTSTNNLALNVTNWQDSTGAFFQTARPNATFSVEQRGSDVYIVYAAVPEPGTLMLAGIGLIAVGWAARRRRQVD